MQFLYIHYNYANYVNYESIIDQIYMKIILVHFSSLTLSKIMILCALGKSQAILYMNYPIIWLITLIRGQLTVGGHWKWFHSISHP